MLRAYEDWWNRILGIDPATWREVCVFRPVTLIDGRRGWLSLMRRTVNGEDQYRDMTQEEYQSAIDDQVF